MNCEFCLATVSTGEPQCPNCGGSVRLARRMESTRIVLLAGTEVLAVSSDGSWVRGEILEVRDQESGPVFRVARKGKEPRWMHRGEITVDGDRPESIDQDYEVGDRVSCRIGDDPWCRGTVGAAYGRVYRVDCDDRRIVWVHPDRMRYLESASSYTRRRLFRLAAVAAAILGVAGIVAALVAHRGSGTRFEVREAQIEHEKVPPDLPPPAMEPVVEPPEAGTLVLARPNGADQCYPGRMAGAPGNDGMSPVQLLDGTVVSLAPDDLFQDVVGPGSRVDARGDDGGWHRGTVRERNHEQVLVAFDTGDKSWKSLGDIRLRCR